MIAKMAKGSGFRGALEYDLQKEKGHVLDTNMEGDNVRDLAAEFGEIRKLRPNLHKAVLHTSIAAAPGEKLTDDQWRQIGHRYLDGMGFTDNQFVITRHTDTDHEHIHILANRIRFDGNVVSDSHDWRRQESLMRELEKDYGLVQVAPSIEAVRRAPTQGEIEQGLRTGTASTKQQLQQLADAASRDCTSFTDYQAKLAATGVDLIPVVQQDSTKMSGLSYRLDDVMMKGSDLGKGYSPAGLAKKGITYVKDRDLAAVDHCHQREAARALGGANRDRPPEQEPERRGAGRDPGATGPGDCRPDGRDTRDLGRDRAHEQSTSSAVPETDRDRSQQVGSSRGASTGRRRQVEPGRPAHGVDPLRPRSDDRHPVSDARDRILDLAATANHREQTRSAGSSRPPETRRSRDRDRRLEAIKKQIKAMGGEQFDVLLQHVTTSAKLLRTWTVTELEKMTGWLKRMSARGHDVFIRPSGEHGLVLVSGLTKESVEKMQQGPLAPAAVIEVAPQSYQAWIKLSDRGVTPRVRSGAARALAQTYDGDVAQAGMNDFGRLAGFANHTAPLDKDNLQPIAMARDCPGRVATNGPASVQRIEELLAQADLTNEKQRRMDAIEAMEAEHRQTDPVYEYRRQAKQFIGKTGVNVDLKRMDQTIAGQMLRSGSYSQEGIEQALKFGSPHVVSMTGKDQSDYARQALEKVMAMPQVKRDLQQERTRGPSLGR